MRPICPGTYPLPISPAVSQAAVTSTDVFPAATVAAAVVANIVTPSGDTRVPLGISTANVCGADRAKRTVHTAALAGRRVTPSSAPR